MQFRIDLSRRNTVATSACLAFLLLVFAGCGSAKMAPVSGSVNMRGAPVTGIFVVFQPFTEGDAAVAETRSAMAEVDADGNFTMSTNREGDGVLVGKHKVMIVSVNRNKNVPGSLPPDFAVEVKAGTNQFDLELK